MWSLLLNLLEGIGRIRLPFVGGKQKMVIGRTDIPDALGDYAWRQYLHSRELCRVWGPHPNSPWMPFHCLTLFVALDRMDRESVGPIETDPWARTPFQPPQWMDASTLLFIDLPGPQSAALGALLAMHAGCDLVCTFNNWPHPRGVIKPEQTLAALLRYASLLEKKRTVYPTPGPVAWLCDWGRLGVMQGKPGDFDNRYYIEESIIPGPNYLRERGIENIVYVPEMPNTVHADLGVHLQEFSKAGFAVMRSTVSHDGSLTAPTLLILPPQTFSTMGFFRSSAGGFGAPVPHPSSGG